MAFPRPQFRSGGHRASVFRLIDIPACMTVPKPSLHILCLNTRIIAWILNSSRYGVFARPGYNFVPQRPRTPQKPLDRPICAWVTMAELLRSHLKASEKTASSILSNKVLSSSVFYSLSVSGLKASELLVPSFHRYSPALIP